MGNTIVPSNGVLDGNAGIYERKLNESQQSIIFICPWFSSTLGALEMTLKQLNNLLLYIGIALLTLSLQVHSQSMVSLCFNLRCTGSRHFQEKNFVINYILANLLNGDNFEGKNLLL